MAACNPIHSANAASQTRPALGHSDTEVNAQFAALVDRQNALGVEHLAEIHKQWLGPQGIFATFGAEVERLGRQAPSLDERDGSVVQSADASRAEDVERAVAYALAQSNRRGAAVNPFSGSSREALCCVVFDESAGYTLVERYAAYEAMRQSDSDFFIKLIATTRGVVERRIVFRGLLEHFDRLLPVEKSIYPRGYREIHRAHLEREELLYGPLVLSDSLEVLLRTISPIHLVEQVQSPVGSLP
jgi:hypothetical protein